MKYSSHRKLVGQFFQSSFKHELNVTQKLETPLFLEEISEFLQNYPIVNEKLL